MPSFCRHNRLIQNCQICAPEQSIEPRPLISASTPAASGADGRSGRAGARSPQARRSAPHLRGPGGAITRRRLRTTVDDGFRHPLVPGLKSSQEAESLAAEIAFSATRLAALASDPPGLYAELADPAGDIEERAWLGFLIAHIGPLEEAEDPFAAIRSARTSWASGELPALEGLPTGPRTAHDPERGEETLRAYRSWAARSGSQALAYQGDLGWSAERRFARLFERLALPGLHRAARFDLLLTLGAGVFELQAGFLALGGGDEVTIAAKRALGIGDAILLERRAAQLADGCGVPLGALDLGFYNWEQGERYAAGLPRATEPDGGLLSAALSALGL